MEYQNSPIATAMRKIERKNKFTRKQVQQEIPVFVSRKDAAEAALRGVEMPNGFKLKSGSLYFPPIVNKFKGLFYPEQIVYIKSRKGRSKTFHFSWDGK